MVAMPLKFVAGGKNRLVPATNVTAPFTAVALTIVSGSPSGSVSLTKGATRTGVSSGVDAVSSTATGGRLPEVTVTVKVQLLVLPAASAAVQVTGVVPVPKLEPDGGVQLTVTPGQLSLAFAAQSTICLHCPEAVLVTTLPGQSRIGGSVSVTVTVHE